MYQAPRERADRPQIIHIYVTFSRCLAPLRIYASTRNIEISPRNDAPECPDMTKAGNGNSTYDDDGEPPPFLLSAFSDNLSDQIPFISYLKFVSVCYKTLRQTSMKVENFHLVPWHNRKGLPLICGGNAKNVLLSLTSGEIIALICRCIVRLMPFCTQCAVRPPHRDVWLSVYVPSKMSAFLPDSQKLLSFFPFLPRLTFRTLSLCCGLSRLVSVICDSANCHLRFEGEGVDWKLVKLFCHPTTVCLT